MRDIDRRAVLKALGTLGLFAATPGCVRSVLGGASGKGSGASALEPQRFAHGDLSFRDENFVVLGRTLDGQPGRWSFAFKEARLVELSAASAEQAGVPPIAIGFRSFDASSRYDAWPLPEDEFLYGISGHLRARVGEDAFDCMPGDVLWIPKGTVVAYEAVGEAHVFYAAAPPHGLIQSASSPGSWEAPNAVAPVAKPVRARYDDREYMNVPAQLRKFSDGTSRIQKCNFNAARAVDLEQTMAESTPAAAYGSFPADSLHGWMEIPYNEIIVGTQGHFRAILTDQRYETTPSETRTLDCLPGDVLWMPKGTYVNYENVGGAAEVFFMLNPGCCFELAAPGEWEPDPDLGIIR